MLTGFFASTIGGEAVQFVRAGYIFINGYVVTRLYAFNDGEEKIFVAGDGSTDSARVYTFNRSTLSISNQNTLNNTIGPNQGYPVYNPNTGLLLTLRNAGNFAYLYVYDANNNYQQVNFIQISDGDLKSATFLNNGTWVIASSTGLYTADSGLLSFTKETSPGNSYNHVSRVNGEIWASSANRQRIEFYSNTDLTYLDVSFSAMDNGIGKAVLLPNGKTVVETQENNGRGFYVLRNDFTKETFVLANGQAGNFLFYNEENKIIFPTENGATAYKIGTSIQTITEADYDSVCAGYNGQQLFLGPPPGGTGFSVYEVI